MIATHNIKVNGRWIHAGEEYDAEPVKETKPAEKAERKPETKEPEAPAVKEVPKQEEKPKSAPRRKKISE